MKNKMISVIIAAMMFLSVSSCARNNVSGIYMNIADFQHHKLTYAVDCAKESERIRLNDFFNQPYINILVNGGKLTLQKKDIYGYQDCKNTLYRFYNNSEYKFVDSGRIKIYTQERDEKQGREGFIIVTDYFFSTSDNGEIQMLTANNLKKAFPDNQKFGNMLDENSHDGNISSYDAAHQMYIINYWYQESLVR